jgi:hypothetical protein
MAVEFVWDGLQRTARVILSANWRDEHDALGARPVLLVLHDEDASTPGDVFEAEAGFRRLVQGYNAAANYDRGRFVVVIPDGLEATIDVLNPRGAFPNYDPHASWASGHRGRDAIAFDMDDVGFIEELLFRVDEKLSADLGAPVGTLGGLRTNRVFAVGLGNGGEMAFRLAMELRDRSAAVRGTPYAIRSIAVIGASNYGQPLVEFFTNPLLTPDYMALPLPSPAVAAIPVFAIVQEHDPDFASDVSPASTVTLSQAKVARVEQLGVPRADSVRYAPISRSVDYSLDTWASVLAAGPITIVGMAVPTAPSVQVDQTDWNWLALFGLFLPLRARLWTMRGGDAAHYFPSETNAGGFSAAVEVWNFFVEHYDG